MPTLSSSHGRRSDVPYRSARFGAALAAGDLDGDGKLDLAVGTPGSDLVPGDQERSGSVLVYFGGDDGLSASRTGMIRRPSGVSGFGSVLAIGDVNRDERPDLLEGAPGGAGHAILLPEWTARATAVPPVSATPAPGRRRSPSAT